MQSDFRYYYSSISSLRSHKKNRMVGLASRAIAKWIILDILDFDLFELASLAIVVWFLWIVARSASNKKKKNRLKNRR